jgi:hypothetical protein
VDDIWLREAIEAQIKELAEKRAINTANQLNEIHGAVRKEMNDKTWIYTRDVGALYREATAKIKTLEAEVKELAEKNIRLAEKVGPINIKYMEVRNQLKAANINYNKAVVENIRLNRVVNETTHANDGLIKRNIELGWDNNRLQAELNNLAPASHSDKDVAIRNDELRDQFAIAAMNGVLSVRGWHPEYIIPAGAGHVGGQRAADTVAEQAYVYADAMLKAREKKNA